MTILNPVFDFLWWVFLFYLGATFGYWLCTEKYGLHKEMTCNSEKNIHIFDGDKEFCHCLRTSRNGETFTIPIKAQQK